MSSKARRDVAASSDGRPKLIFAFSPESGPCRQAEGFLAQVLQRRGNHETFELHRLDVSAQPRLAETLDVRSVPSLLVVVDGRIAGRLEQPIGVKQLGEFLAPWLR
jgi:thioredoxin-like negative regulator of GroEL